MPMYSGSLSSSSLFVFELPDLSPVGVAVAGKTIICWLKSSFLFCGWKISLLALENIQSHTVSNSQKLLDIVSFWYINFKNIYMHLHTHSNYRYICLLQFLAAKAFFINCWKIKKSNWIFKPFDVNRCKKMGVSLYSLANSSSNNLKHVVHASCVCLVYALYAQN